MFCIGYATEEEIKDLEARGWEVENASDYTGIVGDDTEDYLVGTPSEGKKCIVVFTDNSVFEVMNGPDWEPPFKEEDEHPEPEEAAAEL